MLHTGSNQTVLTAEKLRVSSERFKRVGTAHVVNKFEVCWPILCLKHDERFKSDVKSLVAP